VLHAVRIGFPGVLGDGPAILPRQIRQQPEHELPGPPPSLHPGEPTGHPIEQPVGLGRPPGSPYAVAHGHRLIISRRHNRA
jgi:hypothetical protein